MKKKNLQNGFSLLEILLTVIVLSGLLLAVFSTFQNYAEKTLARSTATYMDQIHTAVEELLYDPRQFIAIYTIVSASPNRIIDVPLADLISGTGLIPAAANNLNANFQTTTPWKTGYNILIRAADNPADPDDIPTMEVIIATNERVHDKRVTQAATYSNGHGGFFKGENKDGSPSTTVESAFDAWSFDIANLNGTPLAAAIAGNPPSYDDGTYYVHYSHYNFNDITGDYLYRDHITGRPELNRMFSPLNMGQNNIMGADDLDPTVLTLSGNAIVSGSARVAGDTTIDEGNVDVRNGLETSDAEISGNGTTNTGSFVNQGTVNVSDTSAFTDSVNAGGARFDNNLTTTAKITSTRVVVTNVTKGTNTFADNMTTDSTRANLTTGQLNTSNINATTYNQPTGNLATIDMLVGGDMEGGDLSVSNALTINSLDTTNFGQCDNGC